MTTSIDYCCMINQKVKEVDPSSPARTNVQVAPAEKPSSTMIATSAFVNPKISQAELVVVCVIIVVPINLHTVVVADKCIYCCPRKTHQTGKCEYFIKRLFQPHFGCRVTWITGSTRQLTNAVSTLAGLFDRHDFHQPISCNLKTVEDLLFKVFLIFFCGIEERKQNHCTV